MRAIHARLISCFIILNFPGISFSQNTAIGEWTAHIPYQRSVAVAVAADKVYCASESGVFIYNKNDNSTESLTKVNGLSDVGISFIRYSNSHQLLFIAYENGNIDLVEEKKITNFSDIVRSNIIGNKRINNIFFSGDLAYISCGFGIVVFDMLNREVKDSYRFGTDGQNIYVNDVTTDGSSIFAATNSGVYYASLSNSNLTNFNAWSKFNTLPYPDSTYNAIAWFGGKVYVNFKSDSYNSDTLYYLNENSWNKLTAVSGFDNLCLEVKEELITITHNGSVQVYDPSWNKRNEIFRYHGEIIPQPSHALFDGEVFWIADRFYGLAGGKHSWQNEIYTRPGPYSNGVHAIRITDNDQVKIASGGRNDGWQNVWRRDGISTYSGGEWRHIHYTNTEGLVDIHDYLDVIEDPLDNNRFYAATLGSGLLEFNQNKLANIYDHTNSSLNKVIGSGDPKINLTSLAYDEDNNLWMTNPGTNRLLSVKTPEGEWQDFNFTGITAITSVARLIITTSGHKWLLQPNGKGNSILVLDDNGTLFDESDDRMAGLNHTTGTGNIPGGEAFCMVEDLNGEIWIGTNEGIGVIYSPGNVFSGSGFDAQRIFVMQDGYTQYLMETEAVSAIAVDGGNRKWIGTMSGGLFLMSADGTEQIHHFNKKNSPLPSNHITAVTIDHKTGEVFIGTEKGLISFRGDATAGAVEFSEVYAYPNPVRNDFEGKIAIKGLVSNVNVKITDISGNLVYETTAEGGQATWNGRNSRGDKAATGVYLVFCSNNDGTKTHVTKILIIN